MEGFKYNVRQQVRRIHSRLHSREGQLFAQHHWTVRVGKTVERADDGNLREQLS